MSAFEEMTAYGIEVFQVGRDPDLNRLRQAVAAELQGMGLHRSLTVVVSETPAPDESPRVGVYLGSPDAAAHNGLRERLVGALNEGTVVVPVVGDLATFADEVPDLLAFANGLVWGGDDDLPRIVRCLLEELGNQEKQRRVFISHKRDDGLGAAEQLHDHLTHSGFLPFIDRFAIRPGRDVQGEIADALEDHAFLLLLETPLAHTSAWVFDEVDYALSHTMGIVILSWPGSPVPVPGSIGLPRVELQAGEIMADAHGYHVLTAAAIDRVVSEVEAAHARGLARRRRIILRSIEEAARGAGVKSCVPLRDWRLLIEDDAGVTLVGTTPRLPTALDLQTLDEAAAEQVGDPACVLVHSARVLGAALRKHLGWVVGERRVTIMPENAVGGRWF